MSEPQERAMSLRERQKAEARRHLLDTAANLFMERGYDETTIEDIARAAGTARATVYAYFPGKDRIVAELAQEMWTRAAAMYTRLADLRSWTRESLHGWVVDLSRTWAANAQRLNVVTRLAQNHIADEVFAFHERVADQLAASDKHWGTTAGHERRLRSMLLILQVEGFFSLWTYQDFRINDDNAIPTFVDVLMGVLGVSEPAKS